MPGDSGKGVDLFRERGDGGEIDVALQLDGAEQMALVSRDTGCKLLRRHVEVRSQPFQQLRQLCRRHLSRDQVHRERRPVGHQWQRVATLEYLAPLGGNGDLAPCHVDGQVAKLHTAHHLQQVQIAGYESEDGPGRHGQTDRTALEHGSWRRVVTVISRHGRPGKRRREQGTVAATFGSVSTVTPLHRHRPSAGSLGSVTHELASRLDGRSRRTRPSSANRNGASTALYAASIQNRPSSRCRSG